MNEVPTVRWESTQFWIHLNERTFIVLTTVLRAISDVM